MRRRMRRIVLALRVHQHREWSRTTDRLTRLTPHQTARISKSPRRPRPRVCRVTVMEVINSDVVFTQYPSVFLCLPPGRQILTFHTKRTALFTLHTSPVSYFHLSINSNVGNAMGHRKQTALQVARLNYNICIYHTVKMQK